MTEHFSNHDRLERELAELKSGVKRSIALVADLASIRQDFAGSVDTYNALIENLATAEETLTDHWAQFDALTSELEEALERLSAEHAEHIRLQVDATQAISSRNEQERRLVEQALDKTQHDLRAVANNLRAEIALQAENLRGQIDRQLQDFRESQNLVEETLGSRLDTLRSELDANGPDAETLRDELSLLQEFSTTFSARVERSTRRLDRDSEAALRLGRVSRNLALVAVILGAVALSLQFAPELLSLLGGG